MGCQGQMWLLFLTCLPRNKLSLFPSGCRLPGACYFRHIPNLHSPASLWPLCMHNKAGVGAGTMNVLTWKVVGHFSNTALHFKEHSSDFKVRHSCIRHLSFKNEEVTKGPGYIRISKPGALHYLIFDSPNWKITKIAGQKKKRKEKKTIRKGLIWWKQRQSATFVWKLESHA